MRVVILGGEGAVRAVILLFVCSHLECELEREHRLGLARRREHRPTVARLVAGRAVAVGVEVAGLVGLAIIGELRRILGSALRRVTIGERRRGAVDGRRRLVGGLVARRRRRAARWRALAMQRARARARRRRRAAGRRRSIGGHRRRRRRRALVRALRVALRSRPFFMAVERRAERRDYLAVACRVCAEDQFNHLEKRGGAGIFRDETHGKSRSGRRLTNSRQIGNGPTRGVGTSAAALSLARSLSLTHVSNKPSHCPAACSVSPPPLSRSLAAFSLTHSVTHQRAQLVERGGGELREEVALGLEQHAERCGDVVVLVHVLVVVAHRARVARCDEELVRDAGVL